MKNNEIKCGIIRIENRNIQITIDDDYVKRFYELIIENNEEKLIPLDEVFLQKINTILNYEDNGIIELSDKELYKDNIIKINKREIEKLIPPSDKLIKMENPMNGLEERIEKQYIPGLATFLDTLRHITSSGVIRINLPHLDKLLSTLIVRSAYPNELKKVLGRYYHFENVIVIKDISAYMHELLHMASTRIDKKFGKVIGFRYLQTNSFGSGLNEFATEFIANKLFNERMGYFSEYDHNIIERLVNMIGFNWFLKCYFEMGIPGLIFVMSFTAEENCSKLIVALDNYFNIVKDMSEPKTDLNYNGFEVCSKLIDEINQILDVIEMDYYSRRNSKRVV